MSPDQQQHEPVADDEPAVLECSAVGLRTAHGWVVRDLSLHLASGTVTALVAPGGSGKSAALLILTGRMALTHGSLIVGGLDAAADARRIRSTTSVARLADLATLEGRHTISEAVVERSLIDGIRPERGRRRYRECCDRLAFRADDTALIEDLPRWQQGVLALILAALRSADVIVIDDTDDGVTTAQENLIYQAAQGLSRDGCVIVGTTSRWEGVPAGVDVISLDTTADEAEQHTEVAEPENDTVADRGDV